MFNNLRLFGAVFGFFLLVNTFLPISGKAQQLGLANSNFSGINSLYTNPSAIADARHAFYLNLFSAEGGATNNYFRYEGPVSLFKLFKDNLPFEDSYIKENLNGKPKLLSAGVDVRGPGFMLRLNAKQSIGFTSRVRGGFQVNNLSEDIARLYKLEGGSDGNAEDLINKLSGNNSMNLNANVFSEFGFSYARVLMDKGQHFVKAGVTLKKLSGGYSAHFINDDTQFKIEERPIPGSDQNDIVLKIDKIKTKYGYLSEKAVNDLGASDIIGMLTGNGSLGKGWGTDIGFTYEYRPKFEKYRTLQDGKEVVDQKKNKYKYRLGFSLMDIGSINYNNPDYVLGYDLEKTNKELKLTDFENAETTEDAAEIINKALGITPADKVTAFRSGLPTTLNLNLDYKISGPLYINTTLIQGLRGKNAIGMRQNSLFALTPRLEMRALEVSVPVALQNNYSVVTVGTMLRVGPLFIGSDNIGGAFNLGSPYGANVYAGLALPISKRSIKDKDKDGVSNKKDKCKTVPGTLEMFGCPDKDKDGVADKEDACPEVAGTVELKGCPPAEVPKAPATDSLKVQPQPVDTAAKAPVIPLEKKTADSVKVAPIDSVKIESGKVPATEINKPAAESQVVPVPKPESSAPVTTPQPATTVPAATPIPATKSENTSEVKPESAPAVPAKKDEPAAKTDNLSGSSYE